MTPLSASDYHQLAISEMDSGNLSAARRSLALSIPPGVANFQTVRNVYVPLRINGQRWGDFEIAYVI